MKKTFAIVLVLTFIILALCSCGAKQASEELNRAQGIRYDADGVISYSEYANKTSAQISDEFTKTPVESPVDESVSQKLIKKYSFVIESLEYDKAKSTLETLVARYGGYFSSSSESIRKSTYADTRYGTFQVRIPSDKVDAFASEVKTVGNVTSSTLNTEDVTESYYSLKSQLESLALQEERVLSMIEKANDLNTLIKLEDKLASIRSEINNINYRIKYYDSAVDHSYVTVNLSEVVEYTEVQDEDTFGSRLLHSISNTFVVFGNVLGEILIVFIWILPFALALGIVAVVVVFVTKRNRKKKAEKQNRENQQ